MKNFNLSDIFYLNSFFDIQVNYNNLINELFILFKKLFGILCS